MSESTTDDLVDTGADNAQPADQDQPSAALQPQEPTANADEAAEPEASADSTDENLDWLQKKGIDPSDPGAVAKVAKMYRDAERAMHDSTAKASELQKVLSQPETAIDAGEGDYQQLAAEVAGLKTVLAINTFFESNPDAKALEPTMAKMVNDDPALGQLVNAGYLNMNQLYAMAKGSDAGHETKLKADGGKEALERVASKQQAKAIPGAATTSAMSSQVTKANFDEWYSGLSADERAKPETQNIVNSLLS